MNNDAQQNVDLQYDPDIKNKFCPLEMSRLPKEERINFKHILICIFVIKCIICEQV